jgi:hypothetical protein
MIYKKPLEISYKHNIFILHLRSFLLLIIFRRNLVRSKNATRKLKIHNKQNKHKQFSISLYVTDGIETVQFLI